MFIRLIRALTAIEGTFRRIENMANTIQDLTVAIASMQSDVTDVRADLDSAKTEISAANARLAQIIADLKGAQTQDFSSQVSAINAVLPVLQGVSVDLKAIVTSEKTL